jgi:hypothetical protein
MGMSRSDVHDPCGAAGEFWARTSTKSARFFTCLLLCFAWGLIWLSNFVQSKHGCCLGLACKNRLMYCALGLRCSVLVLRTPREILLLLHCVVYTLVSMQLRGCLFELLPAFHRNKPRNRTKQVGFIASFSKAKAADTLGERSTLGGASRGFPTYR